MLELHALQGNIVPRLVLLHLSNAIRALSVHQLQTRIKTIVLIVQQVLGVQKAQQMHHLNVLMALTALPEQYLMMSSAVLPEKHPLDPQILQMNLLVALIVQWALGVERVLRKQLFVTMQVTSVLPGQLTGPIVLQVPTLQTLPVLHRLPQLTVIVALLEASAPATEA